MEQLNRVEIRGIVGYAHITDIGDTKIVRFSVATDYAYENRSGEHIIETTWHNVTALQRGNMPDLTKISKGMAIEVKGRLRIQRYVDAQGIDKTTYDILASEITIINDKQPEE
ncbi:MAG: single-stranded DNA-binding protein [Bacteroidales bacterium]|nr:single-stranded DNA-binding protein [Bacteroidales bacterium]